MTVQVKFRMNPGDDDLAPRKAHDDDAAFDLRSRAETVLGAGTRKLIPTGLFLELPGGYEAQVRPRSGLALKHGVTVLNTPGTIDAGYRGEVGVILINTDREDYVVHRGERIAQMLIKPVLEVDLVSADELADSARGEGGFGSTGRH